VIDQIAFMVELHSPLPRLGKSSFGCMAVSIATKRSGHQTTTKTFVSVAVIVTMHQESRRSMLCTFR